jgi:hypothetical protein
LTDLESEQYDSIVDDLARHLASEIGDQPVSELGDDLRRGLRESLEAIGHFESKEVEAELMSAPLANLRREEMEVLALGFGQAKLREWDGLPLRELPQAERESALEHLQAHGRFVDQRRLDRLLTQPLHSLESDIRRSLIDTLRSQQRERMGQQRLKRLSREERSLAHRILKEEGLAFSESQMRPFRRQALEQLQPEVYAALLRDLGEEAIGSWSSGRFQDLEAEHRAILSAHLGRRIMGRIERRVMLHTISRLWIDYLTDIEDLRRGIGLEAYGQRDPLVEYKRRAYELFEELGENIRRTVVRSVFRQPPEPLTTGRGQA